MRTLFLDFDGVLHLEFCHESRHFSYLPFFEQVLRSTADVDVVVRSTWRQQCSLDQLRSRFSTDVAHRVIGVTPGYKELVDAPDSLLGYEREAECHAWLRTRDRAVFPWLAVDDRPWLYRPFSRSLFLVDGKTGMTDTSAAVLIRRIHEL
ncbi:HAD domain-containing protein [Acidovorax delafieldii]|uniref:HAD domain-containing protein n=1 Tax=Acidovorax delafieldii TaxID=47920 RepID=UPI003ECE9852